MRLAFVLTFALISLSLSYIPQANAQYGPSRGRLVCELNGQVTGNSVQITTTLQDTDGDGVSGQNINFTVLGGSGGQLDPPSDVTGNNGEASVTLFTDGPGQLIVRATTNNQVACDMTVLTQEVAGVVEVAPVAEVAEVSNIFTPPIVGDAGLKPSQ
ncbi:MAG: hypothetical protein GEU75_02355 [Dehalococcoidia bacterium]|nr:hypothetical protein [Dehalococcoidia bacterium]